VKPRPILTACIIGASIIIAAAILAQTGRWQTSHSYSADYGTCMAFDSWTSRLIPCAK
jgi:hypothetical protein